MVLPAHIGAERIAEMILYPDSANMIRSAEQMQGFGHNLHNLGLNLDRGHRRGRAAASRA